MSAVRKRTWSRPRTGRGRVSLPVCNDLDGFNPPPQPGLSICPRLIGSTPILLIFFDGRIGWDLSFGLHILTFFQTGHSPMRLRTALTFLALSVTGTSNAFATSILAKVHIAAHHLNVSVGGKPTYSWGIATARRGYHTPRGTYHVTALDIDAYSWKYDAPMPYAVCFIRGDYCIHAGHSIGRNASHGCIRLAPSHAIRFFYLVSANRGSTTIVVH